MAKVIAILLAMVVAVFSFNTYDTIREEVVPIAEIAPIAEIPAVLLDVEDWAERFDTAWSERYESAYTLEKGPFEATEGYMDLAYGVYADALMLEVYQWLETDTVWFAATLFDADVPEDEAELYDGYFVDTIVLSLAAYGDGMDDGKAEGMRGHLDEAVKGLREAGEGEEAFVYGGYHFSVSYDAEYGWMDCYYCLD